MAIIQIYTDGACSGNPGPGGWGCVLIQGKNLRRMSGYEEKTTNNRMELQGVIKALEVLLRPVSVKIFTDSKYVKNAFTEGWLRGWEKNGWRTASGGAVKNQDLWLILSRLQRMHELEWEWVRGHSGDKFNEVCDSLARAAIVNRRGIDERSVEESAPQVSAQI